VTKAMTVNFFTTMGGDAMTTEAENKCVLPAHITRQETGAIKPEQRTRKYYSCPNCHQPNSEFYLDEDNRITCQQRVNRGGKLVICHFRFFVNKYNVMEVNCGS
jgi:hypothetical protein